MHYVWDVLHEWHAVVDQSGGILWSGGVAPFTFNIVIRLHRFCRKDKFLVLACSIPRKLLRIFRKFYILYRLTRVEVYISDTCQVSVSVYSVRRRNFTSQLVVFLLGKSLANYFVAVNFNFKALLRVKAGEKLQLSALFKTDRRII